MLSGHSHVYLLKKNISNPSASAYSFYVPNTEAEKVE